MNSAEELNKTSQLSFFPRPDIIDIILFIHEYLNK